VDEIEQHLNAMINICEGAINDTYEWEREQKTTTRLSWGVLLLNIGFIVVFTVAQRWYGLPLMLIPLWLGMKTLRMGEDHRQWILDTRQEWVEKRQNNILQRAEYLEQL
jgi:hypothetical protein